MKKAWIVILAIITLLFTSCSANVPISKDSQLRKEGILKEGNVKKIVLSTLPESEKTTLTFNSDIKEIVEYLISLDLIKDFEENPREYVGGTWVIELHYSDNSKQTVYHFGNMFISSDNGEWYKMDYEQASKLDSVIEKLK